MAKNIKAIKCPHCGSVDKKDLGDERFECESCGTEYYLDDDYTHIVHHHRNYDTPAATTSTPQIDPKKLKNYTIGISTLITIIFIFINLIPAKKSTHTSTYSPRTDYENKELVVSKNKKGQLITAFVAVRLEGQYPNYNRTLIAHFYDQDSKLIKKRELKTRIGKTTGFPIDVKYMSNGDTYIIYNDKILLRIDPDALSLDELGDEFYGQYPELASGVAKVEEAYYQDGLKILSQDGKSYVLLPIIKQIIPADMEYKIAKKTPPNAKDENYYTFCDYDIGKLVKYTQKSTQGYLRDIPYFDCDDGDISNTVPDLRFKKNTLVNYKYLTNRVFFNAKILGYDDQRVIIKTTLDAADDTPNKVQALNPNNGEVLWTYEFDEPDASSPLPQQALSSKDKTIITLVNRAVILDNKTGKKLSEIKI